MLHFHASGVEVQKLGAQGSDLCTAYIFQRDDE